MSVKKRGGDGGTSTVPVPRLQIPGFNQNYLTSWVLTCCTTPQTCNFGRFGSEQQNSCLGI